MQQADLRFTRNAACLICALPLALALAGDALAQVTGEMTQTFSQNGSGHTTHGDTYLQDIGHISSFNPFADGTNDDSGTFQTALDACGPNFGTLEVTQPQNSTSSLTYTFYVLWAGNGTVPPLYWGPGASCKVIIRKGAIISGSLPPPDSAHFIFDENALPIDPFPTPSGFLITSDTNQNSAVLTTAGLSAGVVPFGGMVGTFFLYGPDAIHGATDASGGNLLLGPGQNTGMGNGSTIYFQVSPAAGSSGNTYDMPVNAWSIASTGNLGTTRSGESVGTAAGPIDSLYICPAAAGCTYNYPSTSGYYNITGTNTLGSGAYTQKLPNNSGTMEVANFATTGDIGYYNGTTFSVLSGNTATGTQVLTESSSSVPAWKTIGGQSAILSAFTVSGGTVQIATSASSAAAAAGTVYRLSAAGQATAMASGANYIKVLSGPGSPSDSPVVTLQVTSPASGTDFFSVECILTVRTTTMAVAGCTLWNNGAPSAGISTQAVAVSTSTTAQPFSSGSGNVVELAGQTTSGTGNSFTFNNAFIEVVKP